MVRPARVLASTLTAVALLAAACSEQAPSPPPPGGDAADSSFPRTLTDDEGVEVSLDAPPERIITFAPSHTEIVFALGLSDRLVGVSGAFDDYPPEAQEIEPVAGRSGVEPNIETVVSLEPDIVLTAFIGGEWKERLRELDIPVFTTLAVSLEDTLADIGTIGTLLGVQEESNALVAELAVDVGAVQQSVG